MQDHLLWCMDPRPLSFVPDQTVNPSKRWPLQHFLFFIFQLTHLLIAGVPQRRPLPHLHAAV